VPIVSTADRNDPILWWAHLWVMVGVLCPKRSWTAHVSTPVWINLVAKVCRSPWKWRFSILRPLQVATQKFWIWVLVKGKTLSEAIDLIFDLRSSISWTLALSGMVLGWPDFEYRITAVFRNRSTSFQVRFGTSPILIPAFTAKRTISWNHSGELERIFSFSS